MATLKKILNSDITHVLTPLPPVRNCHFLRPTPPSSVTYFMGGP